MNDANPAIRHGAFTILGFTKEPEDLLNRRLSRRLGVVPRILEFGTAGRFFFYTSYGDVAETEQAIVLKLGFARSPTKSLLTARQLLAQKIATPQSVEHTALRGNALAACFSKTEAKFAAFKTLMSLPQLYYWASHGVWFGSDNLRCLISILDHVELNDDIVPFHFVFRHAPGTLTYYNNVQRLYPGQLLTWQEGHLDVRCTEDLRFSDITQTFERIDPRSIQVLYQELQGVVRAYIDDIQSRGHSLGNLLSGGVDSSLVQLIINEPSAPTRARSFSFAPDQTPSFEFEVRYARQASEILKTEHTFVKFKPEDYPSLIVKATEVLGQPVLSDVEPCKLALAEFLAAYAHDLRFFCVAQGADTLFGLDMARKLKILDALALVPGSRQVLEIAGRLLKPFSARGQTLLKGAEILAREKDPALFVAPINTIAVYTDLDLVRRWFGDGTVRRVLEYRRDLETQYLNSTYYTEKVHIIDLLSDTYEIQVQSSQLFQAHNKEQIYPFLDDDILRASFAFRPEIRYIQGSRTKPLLKDILELNGLSVIARKPKGGSVFTDDLYAWMRSGPLREMVQDIALPGFISKPDFEHLLQEPDHTLWSILTFDLFQKRILSEKSFGLTA